MTTRLPVERLAEWLWSARHMLRQTWSLREVVEKLRAWLTTRTRDNDHCSVCGTWLTDTERTRGADGADLCQDPACHAVQIEGRW